MNMGIYNLISEYVPALRHENLGGDLARLISWLAVWTGQHTVARPVCMKLIDRFLLLHGT